MIDWSGSFHIMATPFTEGGEAHRLTDDERCRVALPVVILDEVDTAR